MPASYIIQVNVQSTCFLGDGKYMQRSGPEKFGDLPSQTDAPLVKNDSSLNLFRQNKIALKGVLSVSPLI